MLLCFLLSFFMLLSPDDFSYDKFLVGYYSFDYCDARDESGYNSDGILHGNPECWCGVKDDGLLLDGRDDYIEFEGIINRYFKTSDFTVSFYIRPTGQSPFKTSLLSKKDSCGMYPQMDFVYDGVFNKVEVEVRENEFLYYPGLSTSLDSMQWKHIVLVRKGTEAFTYINGTLRQKSRKCRGVDISNDANLKFGDGPCIGSGLRRFKGVVDEIKIFDKALSDEEVLHLYRSVPIESAHQDCFS